MYDFFTFDSILVKLLSILTFPRIFSSGHIIGVTIDIKQIFVFGERWKKPNYFRGTKTLLGNKLGNIRKQIFDF